jgi:hypothetical protein
VYGLKLCRGFLKKIVVADTWLKVLIVVIVCKRVFGGCLLAVKLCLRFRILRFSGYSDNRNWCAKNMGIDLTNKF